MMRPILCLIAGALGILAPVAPALADDCDDLWFTRNLVMHRAGYCFGSDLGKAVFGNAGCTGKFVELEARAQALIRQVWAEEKYLKCKVDTTRRSLSLADIDIRRTLSDLPVMGEGESGCIGWREGTTKLYGGQSKTAAIVGQIEDGDSIGFSHISVDGWAYVTVWDGTWTRFKSAGWLGREAKQSSCDNWAG